MLIDSNIIIYAAQPDNAALSAFIAEQGLLVLNPFTPETK